MRWIHHHHKRRARYARDWRNVANEIEVELLIERWVHRVRIGDQEEGVTVSVSTHDRVGSYISTSTRPVLNDECLVEAFREPLTHPGGKPAMMRTGRVG